MLVCQASPSLILQKESKSWLDVLSECQLWRTSHCSLISTPCPALTTGLPTILFLITSSGQSHKLAKPDHSQWNGKGLACKTMLAFACSELVLLHVCYVSINLHWSVFTKCPVIFQMLFSIIIRPLLASYPGSWWAEKEVLRPPRTWVRG